MNYLYYDSALEYPNGESCYSPSKLYPEYKHEIISESPNWVYDSIRNIFKDIGLDKENYGTAEWNPLGEYVKPGDVVLIKPNLVLHRNNLSGSSESLDCLVTHPSIIRCVIDYVLLALNGSGQIFIGDSPVKDCNLPLLLEKHHYNYVKNFYNNDNITWVDLRGPEEERQEGTSLSGIKVNLSADSYFYSYKKQDGLRIPNYDFRKVIQHHKGDTQEYCVNELVLKADVVINLPKPKTHRKSGYTGALKNFVGINYSKEYLPHHTIGDERKGGDEFYSETILKHYASSIRAYRDIIRTKNKNSWNKFRLEFLTKYEKYIWKLDELLSSRRGLENVREGTWYGNDTLWRTVLDLNKVVHYADKNGIIKKTKQRKVIHICDMIISGEYEGPLAPSPKEEHVILFGTNGVEVDALIVRLMHFSLKKLQCILFALRDHILENDSYENIRVFSNVDAYNNVLLKNIDFSEFEPFHAADGWAGFIEEE